LTPKEQLLRFFRDPRKWTGSIHTFKEDRDGFTKYCILGGLEKLVEDGEMARMDAVKLFGDLRKALGEESIMGVSYYNNYHTYDECMELIRRC
jgi:hypothetical protein